MAMVRSPSPGDWPQFPARPWFVLNLHILTTSSIYCACLQVSLFLYSFLLGMGYRQDDSPHPGHTPLGDLAAKHYLSLPEEKCLPVL